MTRTYSSRAPCTKIVRTTPARLAQARTQRSKAACMKIIRNTPVSIVLIARTRCCRAPCVWTCPAVPVGLCGMPSLWASVCMPSLWACVHASRAQPAPARAPAAHSLCLRARQPRTACACEGECPGASERDPGANVSKPWRSSAQRAGKGKQSVCMCVRGGGGQYSLEVIASGKASVTET